MLHVLTRGTLVFKNWPYPKFELATDYSWNESWQFHQVTAHLVVERGWAELHKFDSRRGEYALTIEGLALASEVCSCRLSEVKYRREETMEMLAGRLICKKCARLIARGKGEGVK
jgi:hypothetical protein